MNLDDLCLIMHHASQAQYFANASVDAVLAKKTTSNDVKSNERCAALDFCRCIL